MTSDSKDATIAGILFILAAVTSIFALKLYDSLCSFAGIILQTSVWTITLAVPVFLYKMTLAFRLIFKGFNATAIKKTRIAWQI